MRNETSRPFPELSRRQRHERHIGESFVLFETESLSPSDEDLLTDEDRALRLRKIVSLRAWSNSTGQSIDLLQLICPSGTRVFMSEERLENYHHMSDFDPEAMDPKKPAHGTKRSSLYLTCPPLESDVDLAVLFHEAGHSTQELDAHTRKLMPYTSAGKNSLTEKCLYSFNRLPFGLAREIIDLCPELEGEREGIDAFEEAYAAMERRIKKSREAIRSHETRLIGLDTKIIESIDGCDRLLRSALPGAIANLETAVARLDERPSSGDRAPLTEEEKTAIQADLSPFGIRLTESPIYKTDLVDFIGWLKGLPAAAAKWVGEIEYDDQEGTMTRPFMNTRRGELVLSIEIGRTEGPFKRFFDTLQGTVEAIARLKEEKYALLTEKSNLYRGNTVALDSDQLKRLKDVVSYPLRSIERDATWRALLWFRLLRDKHGIRLLERPAAGLQQALATLLGCLDTYGAKVDRFKKIANPSPQSWKPRNASGHPMTPIASMQPPRPASK